MREEKAREGEEMAVEGRGVSVRDKGGGKVVRGEAATPTRARNEVMCELFF